LQEALAIDLVNRALGPGARVAVELSVEFGERVQRGARQGNSGRRGRGKRTQARGVRPGAGMSSNPRRPHDLVFYRLQDSATNSFFSNNDNKYIAALVRPKPHQLLLIRAMAASFTPGAMAEPWQHAMLDLRYWSVCSNIYRPAYPVVGCEADLHTTLGATGYYTTFRPWRIDPQPPCSQGTTRRGCRSPPRSRTRGI
jgi:hypothetical protein